MIDITYSNTEIDEVKLEKFLDNCLKFLKIKNPCFISVSSVDEEEIREINLTYRSKDGATDVLSFQNQESIIETSKELNPEFPLELGDIILSPQYVKRQAEKLGNSYEYEMFFLIMHAFLHLLGYDHKEQDETLIMQQLQKDLMKRFYEK